MAKYLVVKEEECPTCNGSGIVPAEDGWCDECDVCNGSGIERSEVDLREALAALGVMTK